jgi:hypothetical protein
MLGTYTRSSSNIIYIRTSSLLYLFVVYKYYEYIMYIYLRNISAWHDTLSARLFTLSKLCYCFKTIFLLIEDN